MKHIVLPSNHYAAGWKTEGVIKPIPEITDLGRRYAELPAAAPEKEALLLELCQCFHPYLMKYLVMICRGHVPVRAGRGSHINKDIKPFLLYFLPKGQKLDWYNMNQIVKHFHLAFKGIDTPEIYDILMGHLVATIKGYDPTYTDKVKLLVEVIENELSTRKRFSFADVNRHLDFDCNRYIRLLGRLGFLSSVSEGKPKKICGYVRSETWPPPPSFFQKGPIGVAHYVQTWFRFKLQEWINSRMREIEAKEGVYSLEGWAQNRDRNGGVADGANGGVRDGCFSSKDLVRSYSGAFQDAHGRNLSADVSMLVKPLDIGLMNLGWVASTNDRLFHNLTKNDRYILYLLYARDLSLADVGTNMGIPRIKDRLSDILSQIKVSAESPLIF